MDDLQLPDIRMNKKQLEEIMLRASLSQTEIDAILLNRIKTEKGNSKREASVRGVDAKEKKARYMREWLAKNPEQAKKAQERANKWRKEHGRPMEKRVPWKEWREALIHHLAERDGWICSCCEIQLTMENASPDHIIPVSSGGEHRINNYRLLCRSCNYRAGGKFNIKYKD